jgi:hypothetical protein
MITKKILLGWVVLLVWCGEVHSNEPSAVRPRRGPASISSKKDLSPITPPQALVEKQDQWASDHIQQALDGCQQRTPQDQEDLYQNLVRSFNSEIQKHSAAEWLGFPDGSLFIEFAEVVMPEYLPVQYRYRGGFTVCSDLFKQVRLAVSGSKRAEKVVELQECFQDAYRVSQPVLVNKLINCYQSLK